MKTKRPAVSEVKRLEVWMKEKGICYLCGKKVLSSEKWDVEHVIARALTFDDSLENLKVAHRVGCHKAKTKVDIDRISKAKRQARETGQQARRKKKGGSIPSAPFPKAKGHHKWPKRPFPSRNPEK